MIGEGIIRKIRNLFHVPGEDIILIGFDDRCKSIRKYQMWSKTANKFDNRLEGKTIEGNVAQPFISYPDTKVSEPSTLADLIEKLQGIKIFKYNIPIPDWFVQPRPITHEVTRTKNEDGSTEEILTFTINKKFGHIFKTEDKPEGIAYLVDMQTGQGGQLIPKQISVERDPVLDRLFSCNPFFWGSTIDSFIATELLRGKVEWWKTLLFMGFALITGLLVGHGL